ncbi:MAG: hypothetical protein V9G23_15670 [Giesbergeria sp.]
MADLRRICKRLGYPVVVLDGISARERLKPPDCCELLDDTPLDRRPDCQLPGAASLAVLPAARGLAELASQAQLARHNALLALQPLLRALRRRGAVRAAWPCWRRCSSAAPAHRRWS